MRVSEASTNPRSASVSKRNLVVTSCPLRSRRSSARPRSTPIVCTEYRASTAGSARAADAPRQAAARSARLQRIATSPGMSTHRLHRHARTRRRSRPRGRGRACDRPWWRYWRRLSPAAVRSARASTRTLERARVTQAGLVLFPVAARADELARLPADAARGLVPGPCRRDATRRSGPAHRRRRRRHRQRALRAGGHERCRRRPRRRPGRHRQR